MFNQTCRPKPFVASCFRVLICFALGGLASLLLRENGPIVSVRSERSVFGCGVVLHHPPTHSERHGLTLHSHIFFQTASSSYSCMWWGLSGVDTSSKFNSLRFNRLRLNREKITFKGRCPVISNLK